MKSSVKTTVAAFVSEGRAISGVKKIVGMCFFIDNLINALQKKRKNPYFSSKITPIDDFFVSYSRDRFIQIHILFA